MGQFANGITVGYDFSKLVGATPTYVTLGELTDVSGPNPVIDTLESTAHGTTSRTYLPGMYDGGDVTFTCRMEADDDTQLNFWKITNLRKIHAWRIQLPFQSASTTKFAIEWDGVTTGSSMSGPFDGLLDMTLSVKVSGGFTITDEA
tara:strand:+ start:4349 stop:4789 length:441 start_codon:yes stop_codon:yes gene_type:complete